jgi:uncharacterized protein YukE
MSVKASASGFSIESPGMKAVTGQISTARDDFGTAITQFGGHVSYPPSAFGSEVSASWSNFNEAWSQELNVTVQAITELISSVTNGWATYLTTDTNVARDVKHV